MADDITHLKPEAVWKYFTRISRVPRCSKHEKEVADYLISVARRLGLEHDQDSVGNVVVRKPASPGQENAPYLALQAHMDMVCEKNSDKVHDFSRDPIEFRLDGDWLYANGTTLGADNGIGVATMLAMMEDTSLVHGPLEFLITVDEETGMTGAFGLSGEFLVSRMILNLDSEEEGAICIGCAGGGDTRYRLPVTRLDTETLPRASGGAGYHPVKVTVSGLRGGHSGVDIHEGRANANRCLIRTLCRGKDAIPESILISDLRGGSKRNAIPREASAVILIPGGKDGTGKELFLKAARSEADDLKAEFRNIDPNMAIDLTDAPMPGTVLDRNASVGMLDMLTAIPHGVLAMSLDIPGLVETSTNFAVMELGEEALSLEISTRSSIRSALEWGRSIHGAIGSMAGAGVTHGESYPGWKPDLDSRILKVAADVHGELFGQPPEIKAIHAGLECGLIKETFPGMDAISIGPQIEHPHSPTERAFIPSVDRFYRYVAAVLERVTRMI